MEPSGQAGGQRPSFAPQNSEIAVASATVTPKKLPTIMAAAGSSTPHLNDSVGYVRCADSPPDPPPARVVGCRLCAAAWLDPTLGAPACPLRCRGRTVLRITNSTG